MKKKYLQIGPYSAVGGVSIHIKRLLDLLKYHYDFSFIDESPLLNSKQDVYNLRSKNVFEYVRLIKKADIIHIHTGIWWLRCIHIFITFLFRKKIIITIHSLSNLTTGFSVWITRMFLSLTNITIVVSKEILDRIQKKDIILIPAFIPPNIEIEEKLPLEILEILQQNKTKKIIISNAFKLVLQNDEDLYGLDLLIAVARTIKREKRQYIIIFVVASMDEKLNLFDYYSQLINEEDLNEVIALISYPISFVRLMLECDLVIRATNTDGDALTIREAIYFKRNIIASDVVKRPDGTILFENRNSQDLFSKIKEVLEKNEKKLSPPNINITNRDALMELYNSIIIS